VNIRLIPFLSQGERQAARIGSRLQAAGKPELFDGSTIGHMTRAEAAMSDNKHPKTKTPSDVDLKRDPGIGASKGTIQARDVEIEDGENTFRGDVDNDTTIGGGVDPNQRRRTNK
jgi:hypothetical protein